MTFEEYMDSDMTRFFSHWVQCFELTKLEVLDAKKYDNIHQVGRTDVKIWQELYNCTYKI